MTKNKRDDFFEILEEPEEKDYIISYIDLLGTKELIKNGNDNEIFELIYTAYSIAYGVAPQIDYFKYISIKIFSDNMLIAYPVNDIENINHIYSSYDVMVSFLKILIPIFIKNNLLLRGAITIGKLRINNLVVWGKGLSEAVYLEENVAVYPRIVLSEKLLKVFDSFKISGVEYEGKFSCLKDFDDMIFFDFFEYRDVTDTERLIKVAKTNINRKIEKESDTRILQKYCWFRNYLMQATDILAEYK